MKYLTTIRLNPEDCESVRLLSKKRHMKRAEVLREAVHNGLVHLVNGEEEGSLLTKRLARRTVDIDGPSFLARLKKEIEP